MSKIDESKLIDAMVNIAEYFRAISELSLNAHNNMASIIKTFQTGEIQGSSSNAPTPEPKQTAIWILNKGSDTVRPYEMTTDDGSAEYRELKAELDRSDHPISKLFGGGSYTVWLMRDGQAIGRRKKQ